MKSSGFSLGSSVSSHRESLQCWLGDAAQRVIDGVPVLTCANLQTVKKKKISKQEVSLLHLVCNLGTSLLYLATNTTDLMQVCHQITSSLLT